MPSTTETPQIERLTPPRPLRLVDENSGLLERPIFIIGCHKSGTSLLRSLLDGHPHLSVLPLEPHYFRHAGFGVEYPLQRVLPREMEWSEVGGSMAEELAEKNASTDRYADSVLSERFEISRFREVLGNDWPSSHAAAFTRHMQSLHYAFYDKLLPESARIVEKSVDNAEFVFLLHRMFPDATFLHIIRNPYATLVSIRRTKQKHRGQFPYLRPLVGSIENSYFHFFRNLNLVPNYHAIYYEDLASSTEETMRKVAGRAGFDFLETLLQPTVNGKQWAGNSSSDRKFQKVSSQPTVRWKQQITALEIELVNRRLVPYLERLGYQHETSKKSPLRPAKGESWQTYIGNRVFLREGA